MKLSSETVRYLVIGQVAIPCVINIAVNFVLGLIAFSSEPFMTTWNLDKGAAADSIGTCFFLPFITCLIATPIVRRHLATGVLSGIPSSELPRWARFMSGPVLIRAFKFGVAGITLLGGPVCAVYWLQAGESIETARFIAVKVIFAGVLGIIVTPMIAIVAMGHSTGNDRS